ncbi:MAG TPA: S8 family serine peptidase [Fimbriimonadaceae bacterium]|nr:S8 family serine peptidase [Fimbriimonadaceae bacterium]
MFLAFCVAFASLQDMPVDIDGALCNPYNLLVKYKDQAALNRLERQSRVTRVMPQIQYAVVRTNAGALQRARATIATWPGVLRVDYDHCARPAYDPNDQYWPNQWDMKAIRTNYAWDTERGDPSVEVAVIDTGVYVQHPDLSPNVDLANSYDFVNNTSTLTDAYGHGTCCAGIVAARQDNTIGISGVAPYCRIMALKAATDSGYFYDSNDVPAYLWAADHGAKVLSMSFFCDRVTPAEEDGINYCWQHGVLPVAAAGNSASVIPYYPGAYDHVLSVAALDANLNMAGFSNYGTWVKVAAPGVGIYATTNDGGYTSGFAGTSGACPHVAGVAALCFSANPLASNQDVMNAIEDTATVESEWPYGEFSNYGLVNAQAAVLRMNGGSTVPHPAEVYYVSRFCSADATSRSSPLGVIKGRGLDGGLVVTCNGHPVNVTLLGRDRATFAPAQAAGNMSISVGGTPVASFTFPRIGGMAYPMSEASTQSATLVGSFLDTLNPDGQAMTVSQRSDNTILVQGTFHNVTPNQTMKVTLRRSYPGAASGTETVQLYNWASASYPYGNFDTLGSGPCPASATTTSYTIGNAANYVDPDGTVYLLITTSSDLTPGVQLQLDMCYLQSN